MQEVLFFICLGGALAAAILAQGLLFTAREHVAREHPEWRKALAAGGFGLRMGGEDARLRRRILRPLVTGRMPAGPAEDPVLRRLGGWLRAAFSIVALGLLGVVLIMWLRVQGG